MHVAFTVLLATMMLTWQIVGAVQSDPRAGADTGFYAGTSQTVSEPAPSSSASAAVAWGKISEGVQAGCSNDLTEQAARDDHALREPFKPGCSN